MLEYKKKLIFFSRRYTENKQYNNKLDISTCTKTCTVVIKSGEFKYSLGIYRYDIKTSSHVQYKLQKVRTKNKSDTEN